MVEANLPASVLTRYVPAEQVLEGAILTRAVGAGELIAVDWISSTGSAASRSMTIPVAPEHAVGGDLRPGTESMSMRPSILGTSEPRRVSSSAVPRYWRW